MLGPGNTAVNKTDLWSSILWGRQTHKAIISCQGVWQGEVGISQGHSRGALTCLEEEGGTIREGYPEEVGVGAGPSFIECVRWVGPCVKCFISIILVHPHTNL